MTPMPGTTTRGVELQQIWLLLRKGWFLLLSGLLVGYVASRLYLRYAAYEYEASAVLQVNSDNLSQGFGFGSLQVNEEGGLGGGSGGVDIIRSKQVLSNVIEKLKLQTAYSSIGRVRSTSLYGGSVPIRVVFDSLHFTLYNRAYEVSPGPTEGTFDFRPAGSSAEGQVVRFGAPFTHEGNTLRIELLPGRTGLGGTGIRFVVQSLRRCEASLYNRIRLQPGFGGANLVRISFTDDLPNRASDIVNQLLAEFLVQDLQTRRRSYDQVITFLDSISLNVAKDVERSRGELSQVERSQNVPILLSQREQKLQRLTEVEVRIAAIDDHRKWLLALSDALRELFSDFETRDNFTPLVYLPSLRNAQFSGLENRIVEQTTAINTLLNQRSDLLQRQKENSPLLQENLRAIARNRELLQETLTTQLSQLGIEDKTLREEYRTLRAELGNYPVIERSLEASSRTYDNSLEYFYLLKQKKTEAEISRAGVVSEHVVISQADPPGVPVSPKRNLISIVGPVAGILLGLSLIVLRELARIKIRDRFDVERLTQVPIVGEVVEYRNRSNGVGIQLFHEANSPFNESMRSLRSNLMFLSANKPNRVIAVTSTISGEGKSITSLNLAAAFGMLGKRVLLVDSDLRRPRLNQHLNMANSPGLSDVLVGYATLQTAVVQTSYKDFDFLPAGTLAPNPTELFASSKFPELVEQLKQEYEYIVFDTSPVGLVVDAMHVLKLASVGLYVVRVDYSNLHFLRGLNELVAEHQLKDLAISLNCVNFNYQGYGHGYGYGYTALVEEPLGWWPRLKRAVGLAK